MIISGRDLYKVLIKEGPMVGGNEKQLIYLTQEAEEPLNYFKIIRYPRKIEMDYPSLDQVYFEVPPLKRLYQIQDIVNEALELAEMEPEEIEESQEDYSRSALKYYKMFMEDQGDDIAFDSHGSFVSAIVDGLIELLAPLSKTKTRVRRRRIGGKLKWLIYK